MLTISDVSDFFEDLGNNVWKCKQTGCLLGHGMLALWCATPTPLAMIGLPRTNEIPVPGHPGVVIMVCERMILVYDPGHVLDSPPGAGAVYGMHIDNLNPGVTQLLALLNIPTQPPAPIPASVIDDLRAVRTTNAANDTAIAKVLTELGVPS